MEGFSYLNHKELLVEKIKPLNLLKPGMEAPNIVGALPDRPPFFLIIKPKTIC